MATSIPFGGGISRRFGGVMRPFLVAILGAALLAASLVAAPAAQAATYSTDNVAMWRTTSGGIVRAIESDGSTTWIGGSFTGLTDGVAPATRPRLAAVDAVTGALIPTFAPQVDGQVWDIVLSADGSMLYVAGQFTTVNGAARQGIVALDPVTGATVASFGARANQYVFDLALDGPWLYLAGSFWNINDTQREKVARVSASTGMLDPSWAPFANNGNIEAVAVDPILDRVYVGGHFTDVDGVPGSGLLAAIGRTSDEVITAWDPSPDGPVYDLVARPGRVYAATGGPGGRVDILDTVHGDRYASHYGDGDLQVLAESGTDVYAGGHHETGLGAGTPASPIARIDGVTDAVDPTFGPTIGFTIGIGIWALHPGSQLWVGGGITSAAPNTAVGLTRYPLAAADVPDSAAPTAPGSVQVDGVSDVTVRLSWAAAVDDSGTVDYVIERDGVALGATRATTFVDTDVAPSTGYSYRIVAVDLAGNAAAATAAVPATTLSPLTEITPVPFGDTWRYLDTGVAPPANWADPAFDDGAWSIGDAELGRDDGDEVTVVGNHVVNWFRNSFDLGAQQVVNAATLRYKRDDGAVIRVNGTEIVRDNVAAGPVTATTPAIEFVFGAQESEVIEVALDPALFVSGANVLAVTIHQAPGSTDSTLDAELTLRVGADGADVDPPSAPTNLTVGTVTEGSVHLSWGAATDNIGVVGYDVLRDGVVVGTTTARSYTDGGLAPQTGYDYTVTAHDSSGNTSAPSSLATATTTAIPAGEVILVDGGAAWRIDDSGLAPAADWTTAIVPSGTWRTGATEIGVGDGGETTLVTARPVIAVRTVFDVGDPSQIGALTLGLLADDGAVAYLNGVEVVRDNIAAGVVVDHTTPAAGYRWTVADETTPINWQIPAGTLVSGANVLAVTVHQGAGSTDVSFDADLRAVYQQGPDTEPPAAPTGLRVQAAASTSLTIGWTSAFDNVAVVGYRVQRDGVEVADVATTSVVDTGLDPASTHEYTVIAYDAAGNESVESASLVAETTGAVYDPVPADAVWRFLDTGIAPAAGWASPAFDDSPWPAGPAQLGAGDGDEATVITARPVTWFRTTFEIADPAVLERADLHLMADDGAAVYVNGVEVARDNLPAGPVGATTAAIEYRWTAADESAFRFFSVPTSAMVAGTNVLAVSLHQAPGSTDLSMAARLEVQERTSADTVPPTAPGTPVAGAVTDTSVALTWAPATDDVALDRYEILRDGTPVGTSGSTAFTDPTVAGDTTYLYAVRAVDTAGNVGPVSASQSVTTPASPVLPVELVSAGAFWRFLDTATAPPAAWTTPTFDDAAWASGPAQLGAGDGDEVTVVTARPVTWYRSRFTAADPSLFERLDLTLMADDGAVVYLNGVEIARDNMPAGPITATTPAVEYRWSAADEGAFREFSVPVSALVAGDNTIAVSLHQAPGSTDLSMAATLTATLRTTADTVAPTAPGTPVVGSVTQTSVSLSWAPATDDVAIDRYEILRDGAVVGQAATTAFVDGSVAAGTAYQYTVRAVDTAGNVGAASGAVSATTESVPPVPVELIAEGAQWRYLDTGVAPPAAWTTDSFDDSTWLSGPAQLGVADGDEATVVTVRPVIWFRHEFAVADPAELADLVLELMADDGAVVWLNGVEVVRDNVAAGPLGPTTAAIDYRWSAADESALRSFVLDPAMLVPGTNVLAVSVHQAPGSGDVSFDARLGESG